MKQTKIDKGIEVFIPGGFTPERVLINEGVEQAFGFDIYNQKEYCKEAYKPANSWRQLTNEEKQSIINDDCSMSYNSGISIHSLTQEIIDDFEKLNLKSCQHRPEALDFIRNNKDIMGLISENIEKLFKNYSFKGKLNYHNISVNQPGIETISSYYKDGGGMDYLGLHLDRSTQFDIHTAEGSRNRICINLGGEDRSFLFINLTVSQLFEKLLTVQEIDHSQIKIGNLSEYFFRYFPNYPVLKLRQKPYEFYIAPTDNCLHDGTTLNRKTNDIVTTFLGYFNHNVVSNNEILMG